jgi:hypothetical protein
MAKLRDRKGLVEEEDVDEDEEYDVDGIEGGGKESTVAGAVKRSRVQQGEEEEEEEEEEEQEAKKLKV